MFKFTFIKNDAKNMHLLAFHFFQFSSARATPKDSAIVYAKVNIRILKWLYDFLFKNDLTLNNVPIFFEILFLMYFICMFQLRTSSNKTIRNCVHSVWAISRLFRFSFGKTSRVSCFYLGLWKNKYLFFFTLSESLSETDHSLIFCNSLFTLRKTVLIFLFE